MSLEKYQKYIDRKKELKKELELLEADEKELDLSIEEVAQVVLGGLKEYGAVKIGVSQTHLIIKLDPGYREDACDKDLDRCRFVKEYCSLNGHWLIELDVEGKSKWE